MILVWLALSLHTFSLIPLLLEDGLYTSKPLYHNKRCYLTHTPLFTSKKITFYIVFLGAGESIDADEILTRPATPNTTLEQRMSLISDAISDHDPQISDYSNVVISLRQAKTRRVRLKLAPL